MEALVRKRKGAVQPHHLCGVQTWKVHDALSYNSVTREGFLPTKTDVATSADCLWSYKVLAG